MRASRGTSLGGMIRWPAAPAHDRLVARCFVERAEKRIFVQPAGPTLAIETIA
jgi:hypothetical protein